MCFESERKSELQGATYARTVEHEPCLYRPQRNHFGPLSRQRTLHSRAERMDITYQQQSPIALKTGHFMSYILSVQSTSLRSLTLHREA
jgi:hypothetical protein